jgi:dolichol-phosphate mannosyltransferase
VTSAALSEPPHAPQHRAATAERDKVETAVPLIGVVIPCYRVTAHILSVIEAIGPEVVRIYVVDDACPDGSGDWVVANCSDPRVTVLRHNVNQGVGGAMVTGYRAAIRDNVAVVVKIDGDGQMDPALLNLFVAPILSGDADYAKGNRFFDLEEIHQMPAIRLFGNAVLSFMSKVSTGYWDLFDPTNGYTAIHTSVLRHLPLDKLSKRYFFETDMLFRLNTLRACVVDVPMDAHYGNEVSNLKISRVAGEFWLKHARNFFKRLFYNYYLRGMSVASLELPLGLGLLSFGLGHGGFHWYKALSEGFATPLGTIMLAAVSLLSGLQFVLAFVAYDVAQMPSQPVHPRLAHRPNLSQ